MRKAIGVCIGLAVGGCVGPPGQLGVGEGVAYPGAYQRYGAEAPGYAAPPRVYAPARTATARAKPRAATPAIPASSAYAPKLDVPPDASASEP